MKYCVGKWKRYNFVWDSDDNSCVMLNSSQVKKLKLENLNSGSIDYMRLVVAYRLQEFFSYYERPLVRYSVPVVDIDGNLYSAIVELGIFLVSNHPYDMRLKKDRDLFALNSEIYCDTGRYSIIFGARVMSLFQLYSKFNLNSELYEKLKKAGSYGWKFINCGVNDGKGGLSISAPVQMINYVISLCKSHNLSGIFKAFDGILDREILIGDCRFGTEYEIVCASGVDICRHPEFSIGDIIWL